MKIANKCVPVGALPYENVKHTTAMMAKLFSMAPFIPVLPNLSKTDTITHRLFENIPGIEYNGDKLKLNVGLPTYKDEVAQLDKAFNNPSIDNLEPFGFHAEFLEKYFQMIKKFRSPNAYINILGPFTVSQMLMSSAQEQILGDKSYRKLFIQAVCIKALWLIEKIKQVSPDTVPIVILEEPVFGQFGMVKREDENVTAELVTGLFAKVIEKLKNSGAMVGIQCLEKCDWSIPIKAGVDLISFDAYNNPNNLGIIPEILTKYLRNGGMVNWGIVPVVSDSMIKGLSIDYLHRRFSSTLGGMILAGVPAELLYQQALVSVNGNIDHLSVMFAERAMMLATQLASRLSAAIL